MFNACSINILLICFFFQFVFQAEVEDNNMRLLLLMMVMVFFITKATEGVPKGKGMEEPTQLYIGDGKTFSLPGFLPVIPPIPYPLSGLSGAVSFTDGDKLSICGGEFEQ